jgi:hypothetical protein
MRTGSLLTPAMGTGTFKGTFHIRLREASYDERLKKAIALYRFRQSGVSCSPGTASLDGHGEHTAISSGKI